MRFLLLLSVSLSAVPAVLGLCDCDMDRDKLGRSTWYLLHEIVKRVPPTEEQPFRMFMNTLGHVYPCEECRVHIKEYMDTHRVQLSESWMCDFHNTVNERLGKELFDCDTINMSVEIENVFA